MFQPVDLVLLIAVLLSSVCILKSLEPCTTQGNIRLVAGNHQYEGRLEVCLQGPGVNPQWGTFCTANWGVEETLVVCRQLGVHENDTLAVFGIAFVGGRSSTTFRWANANCTGNEDNITECTYDSEACTTAEDIGMICAQPNPECTDEDLRIVDAFGNISTEGRVEVCRGNRWGTVCNAEWDDRDAAVVCKQLGLYQANSPMAISRGPSASDRVPISLDFVHCTEDHTKLVNCPALPYVQGCTHTQDAGVNCSQTVDCTVEGLVQLVQGNGLSEGRVEYCRDNLWVSVCRDSWDHYDAQVVCRQLGFVGVSLVQASTYTLPTEQLFRDYLNAAHCVGNETALSSCSYGSSCILGPGAGVKCYNESNCGNDLQVRLVDGVLSNEMGTVELCYGDWGYVCGTSWDDVDARVLCRQLGFTGGIGFPFSPFNNSEGRNFNVANIKCSENDTSITECPHGGYVVQNCNTAVTKKAAVVCGTTAGSEIYKCSSEQLEKMITTNEDSLQVGSFGTCERYQGLSSMCNTILNKELYVFIRSERFNQSWVSYKLDQLLSTNILENNTNCSSMIKSVLCRYFLPPCGVNQAVYVPRAVCPEQCAIVQNSCTKIWDLIATILRVNQNLGVIDCDFTHDILNPLPICCIDLPEISVQGTTEPSDEPTLPASNNQAVMTVAIVMSLLALLLIVVVVVVFAILYVISLKRKKVTLRKLQLDILASASTRSSDGRSPHYLDDSGMLLRSTNGSMKGPLAVPNPYSIKLDLQPSPLLGGAPDSGLMSRVSSSFIRELTSTLLIPQTRLKLLDCVGHGEFGIVYKAHYTEPDGDIGYKTSIVAVKTLKGVFDQVHIDKIMEESIKMKTFDHSNVLNLIGVCINAGPAPYVVMPYMANGSLLRYLKKERRNLVLPLGTDDDVIEVCKRLVVMCMQIACGMEYLAHEKFIHRDLAARNCMIDIHFVIKIADFGLSEDVYAKSYYRQSDEDKSIKLPVKWMAPESLIDGLFSEKSDVWSYGVTCWEVFSGGKTPYAGIDPMTLSQMLEADKRLNRPLNTACPDEMYRIMKQCWAKSPEDRPAFSDLVETVSEYTEKIAGYLDINLYNPFTATYEEIKSPNDDNKIVAGPDQVVQHFKNTTSQLKSTSCSSARNSPFGSPFLTPRGSPIASPVFSDSRRALDQKRFQSPQRRLGTCSLENEVPNSTGGRRFSVGNGPSQALYTPQRRKSESAAVQIKITKSNSDLDTT